MSAPKYKSSSYDSAAQKYQELADRYTGVNANHYVQDAVRYGAEDAKGVAEKEGASALNSSLNAGYSRAKAARSAAAARASGFQNAYDKSYANRYNNIQQANQAALNAQSSLLGGAQQKDANKYQSDSARYGALMGGIGGHFMGAANALSDVTKKNIHEETDSEKRRAELLARLRG